MKFLIELLLKIIVTILMSIIWWITLIIALIMWDSWWLNNISTDDGYNKLWGKKSKKDKTN